MLNRISKIKSFAIAIVMIASLGSINYIAAQRRPVNNLVPQQSPNEAASVIFNAGRDLIDSRDWSKAQDKFSQYVTAYPNAKNVDVALYWMAYAQHKMAKFAQCRETVKHLLDKYPHTTWHNEARMLLAQLPGVYAPAPASYPDVPTLLTAAGSASPLRSDTELVSTTVATPLAIAGQAENALAYSLVMDSARASADDDPCEFKIVVLQALFQTDLQRGIVAATDWLKPGSGQTVRCKQAALSLLGRNGGKAVIPVILNYAKTESDRNLKARAISALGNTNDDIVIDALRDFALNSQETDIVEASLYALSKHSGDRAITVLSDIAIGSKLTTQRKVAISSIAARPGEPAVDALLRIYDADQTLEIRKAVISGFGNRKSERAGSKLFDIARSADAIELRKAAISAISRRGGDKAVEFLLSLYDSEKSEELKDQIINSLGSGSNFWTTSGSQGAVRAVGSNSRMEDQRVVGKLIEIARSPQAPMERRKRAIGWLSRSKDPQVLKFLEDLLK
jgi:HEAT repeat protein